MVSYDSEKTDIGMKKLVLNNGVYSYVYLQDTMELSSLQHKLRCV
jgi:hypothetical protein